MSKWILTYRPYRDKVEVSDWFDIPDVKTWKQVRRWWRESDKSHMKLVKGRRTVDLTK